MSATVTDLTIEQGATYLLLVQVLLPNGDVRDLTDYTAEMQIRASVGSTDPLVTLTLDDGLYINGTEGRVLVEIPAEQTAAYQWTRAVFDLEVTSPDGVVFRLAQGRVRVSKEVTREP